VQARQAVAAVVDGALGDVSLVRSSTENTLQGQARRLSIKGDQDELNFGQAAPFSDTFSPFWYWRG